MQRIRKELKDIISDPPFGITVCPSRDNILKMDATIVGPEGTPYSGGVFQLNIVLPNNYPFKPPTIKFITPIYHCNINSSGDICLDLLKDNWSPAMTIVKVLLSISSLLADPNPRDPLVPEIARYLESDKLKHDNIARERTIRFASNN
jgi:ubiquitin-protein ligase